MGSPLELADRRFGMLVAKRRVGTNKHNWALWECACDCGVSRTLPGIYLTNNKAWSCGCTRRKPQPRHGHGGRHLQSKTYRVWAGIVQRCTNPDNPKYVYYGGRGIEIDPSWRDFAVFLRDMGERPAGMTIDRVDVNGPYAKANCRWATASEQMRNTRRAKLVTYRGETRHYKEWSEITGIHHAALRARIERGWPIEKALTAPFNHRPQKETA